jgi:molecular chaperone GrpE
MSDQENQSEQAQSEDTKPNPEGQEMELLLEDARNKADEHWDALVRTQAELENLRKRQSKELENAHKFALEKFVQELLPIRDSMEMGLVAAQDEGVDLEKLKEGMDLTLKMMVSAMQKFDIEEVNPVGEKFNPEFHQAMSMQESADQEPNTILTVVQKGYQLNGRLVRPAFVIVSKAAPAASNSTSSVYEAEQDKESGGQIDEQA